MKKIPHIIILVVLTTLVVELLTPASLLVSLLAGVFVGAGVAVWLLAQSRGENPEVVAKEVITAAKAAVAEPQTLFTERAVNEQLFRISEELIMSGRAPDLVPTVKEVVYKLREGVKRSLTFAETSETTFNLVKLAKEDLPQQLRAFLNLADADRQSKQSNLQAQLEALSSKIDDLLGMINAGQADAFAAESEFVSAKFNL